MPRMTRQKEQETLDMLTKAQGVAFRTQDAMIAIMDSMVETINNGEAIPAPIQEGVAKARAIMERKDH